MVSAPPNVRRHFLTWERPLLPQAAEYLARDWTGAGPLDLSAVAVVVPTQQSGRRLREALAGLARERDQAAFPPRVLTPKALISPAGASGAASQVEMLLAWVEVLRGIDLTAFREVFPVDPPARGFGWALRLAEQLTGLQSELAETGLRLADVAARAGADLPEAGRWRQLGTLEGAYDEKLRSLGRTDAQAAKILGVRSGAPMEGIARIVVLATPDPMALAVEALAALSRSAPIDVVVFAPEAEAGAFDDWGRPLTPAWEGRPLNLPDFEQRVHLCADPAGQAAWIAALAAGYAEPVGWLGIGVADSEVMPVLESDLNRAGVATYKPEGRALHGEALHTLLSALASLAREPAFEAVEALARCPDFLAHLTLGAGGTFSSARWLEGLDELRSRHLPSDLTSARAHAGADEGSPEVKTGLDAMADLRVKLGSGSFVEGAEAALGAIFAGRSLDLAREPDRRLVENAEAWSKVLRDCAAAASPLPASDWWEVALRLFGAGTCAEEKPAAALEILGWLELLWEDAPHVAVAGFNDGSVPDSVAGDPFLPEGLRERLGLKTNAARFARDAYLMAAVVACRIQGGRTDLLLGKVSAAGEPRRPSRILFGCDEAGLPRRVEFLFGAVPEARANPPWRRAWTLLPPPAARPTRMSVTAFRDYLDCPFRYYLKHGLRLRSIDPHKSELDALDFGTLCHSALEAMGREPALRDCTDAPTLRAFLLGTLERRARESFGRELALPLVIQLESARQRLGRAAEVQAAQRALGWVVERTEEKFLVEVGGVLVSGKIDRIERHRETGRLRVLDYKTSDTPRAPLAAHCRRAGRGSAAAPDFACFTLGGVERVWTDLQLPLYLEALSRIPAYADVPGHAVSAGYFHLPKAVGETAVETWDTYDDAWRLAARRCAEGVAAAVSAGIFWPPAEPGENDEALFEGYFHHGTAASVDPSFALVSEGVL